MDMDGYGYDPHFEPYGLAVLQRRRHRRLVDKIKLVAKLHRISDLASFIRLYLDGSVLARSLEMEHKDQVNAEKKNRGFYRRAIHGVWSTEESGRVNRSMYLPTKLRAWPNLQGTLMMLLMTN